MRFLPGSQARRVALFALFVLLEANGTNPQSRFYGSPDNEVSSNDLGLPLSFERHTGDLAGMIQRQEIRALVLYSRPGFFYIDGRPEGIYYEALRTFEQFVNQTLYTWRHVQVTFIPLRPDKMETALMQGVGDLIAYGVAVTPEREQQVTFSDAIISDAKQIVVGAKKFGSISNCEELSGKKIFVNPLTTYAQSLEKVNGVLRARGKPPILIETADKSLLDADLMEMVNAGLIPATVTITLRANLWSKVFNSITPFTNVVVGNDGDLAFAMRKDSPKLKELVNTFIRTRAVGTAFGNTLVLQYLQSAQYVKDAISESEIKKFNDTQQYLRNSPVSTASTI